MQYRKEKQWIYDKKRNKIANLENLGPAKTKLIIGGRGEIVLGDRFHPPNLFFLFFVGIYLVFFGLVLDVVFIHQLRESFNLGWLI